MTLPRNMTFTLNGTLVPGDYANDSMLSWSMSDLEGSMLMKVGLALDLYVTPLMILVGLVGNSLSFTVFVGTYMRRLSSSIYLAALSVADLAFLLCLLVSWATNTGIDLYVLDGWCQTFIYLTLISSFLGVWYVVCFTVERYISVHYPLRRQALCTTKRAKCVVLGLALCACVLYSYATWTSGVKVLHDNLSICGPFQEYMYLIPIIDHLDTVITLIVPFIAIIVMNVRIAFKVSRFYKERKRLAISYFSNNQSSSGRCSNISVTQQALLTPKPRNTYTRTQVRVTKMLLTVSTIFLLLNLPRHSMRTYHFIMSFATEGDGMLPPSGHNFILWEKIVRFVYYMNFSVNIFLYSVFGKNFRKALALLGRRVRHKVKERFRRTLSICKSRELRSEYKPHKTVIVLKDYEPDCRYV